VELPPRVRSVRTGDLGFLDEDGYLHIVDRESDVVNVGGAKVYSLEVEAALAELDDVEDVAVVGLPHDTLGEYAVAAVTLRRSDAAQRGSVAPHRGTVEAALRRRLREASHAMGPRPPAVQDVVVLATLPRNTAAKVDKRRLREILATRPRGEPSRRPGVAAGEGDDLLIRVLRAWSDALDLDDIDPEESFIALGGNSLLAMHILGELSAELDAELPPRAYFDWATAAELAGVLREILAAVAVH
jgi:acyl carrier protein